MSNDDKYREQADDALRMADRATNDTDRASWRQIAQGWLSMVTRPARTAEQNFDDETRGRQTSSDKSN